MSGRINIIQSETLTAGGGSIVLNANRGVNLLVLSGSATLVGSWTISTTGTFATGNMITTFYKATMTLGGNNITILGKTVPDNISAKEFVAYSIYNGASWDTIFAIDVTQSGTITGSALTSNSIDGSSILDNTLDYTKLVDGVNPGQMLKAGSGGVWEVVDAYGDSDILVGQGADVIPVSLSGHVLMDKTGATTIQPGVITPSMLGFGVGGELRAIDVTLTQAQILALNTSPIVILSDSSVGSGNIIDLVRASIIYNYDTAAFAYSGDAQLEYNDGTAISTIAQADLQVSVDKSWVVPNGAKYDMIADRGIRIRALTADPTGGSASSTLKIRIYYTLMAV